MPGILCEHCTGYCCRYVALPIEKPETAGEFDDVRWYLLHEGISVFVEDGDWYLCMQTACRHLQPDNRCGIYATRPKICRDYSTDGCDYHSGDYGWSQHFTCAEHLDEYLREHPPREARGRKARGRRVHSGLRGKLRPKLRQRKPALSTAAQTDIRGVPLPVLPAFE